MVQNDDSQQTISASQKASKGKKSPQPEPELGEVFSPKDAKKATIEKAPIKATLSAKP